MFMQMSTFIVPAILIILGIILRSGKGSFLMAAFNTSSKQNKGNYDEKALSIFISKLLFFCSAIIIIYQIAITYNATFIKYLSMFILIITVLSASSYVNTGNRFPKK